MGDPDDIAARRVSSNESDIRSSKVKLRYHRNCRSKFTSDFHIQVDLAKARKKKQESGFADRDKPSSSTRSKSEPFNWTRNCFMCGKYCNPKAGSQDKDAWSMIETSTGSKTENSWYDKVLAAAKERQDTIIIDRLLGVANGDLVAVEARYHTKKGCLSRYINSQNI